MKPLYFHTRMTPDKTISWFECLNVSTQQGTGLGLLPLMTKRKLKAAANVVEDANTSTAAMLEFKN